MRSWKTDEGLPNNGVNSLAQTRSGYLWVATETALARFDGFRFEEFSAVLNPATHNQAITALTAARDGSLWMATERGRIVNLGAGEMHIFTNGLPDQWVDALTEDSQGAIWITYRDGSVCRLVGGAVTQIQLPPEWPRGRFISFAVDERGQLWFAKGGAVGSRVEGRVGIWRDGQFQTLLVLGDQTIQIAPAHGGGIWICGLTNLFWFDEGASLKNCGTPGLEGASYGPGLITLTEDRHGGVWIGTPYNGLIYYDGSQFHRVPTSGRNITSLLQDREGNLWAGTAGGGLDRIQPGVVELMNAETGAPFQTVNSACEDSTGSIWVTSPGGVLARRVNDAWNIVSTNSSWPHSGATCVTAGRNGEVWIGTVNHRFVRWQDGRFKNWTRTNGVQSQIIHALLVRRNGELWLAGERPDVVQCLRDGVMTNLSLPENIGITRAMVEDTASNVWVGTEKGALFCINDKGGSEIAPPTDDALFSIRSLYATKDGGVWIGYGGAGLGRFKDGKLARISSARGLLDDYISQIAADDHGWFWFGSDHGIFRVQEHELNAVLDGRSDSVRSVLYGDEKGALEAAYGFAWPGAFTGADGKIWMPMRNSLAVVNPAQVREDSAPSPVLLIRVEVDEHAVAGYGGVIPVPGQADLKQPLEQVSLQLPPQHHRVEFDFTSLSLWAPENVRFRYWLEGLDEHWSGPTEDRSATYSRLPAGDYRFHIMGCNSSGIWNEPGITLAFTVRPFFWKTWWFQSVALATLLLGVIAVVRYVSFRRLRERLRMVEQQAALDKERARIAKDLHDDLGASMTRMTLLLELAQNNAKAKAAEVHVQEGLTAAREAIKSLDAAVWAVNPRNNTLPELIDYIGQFGMEFLQNAKIRFELDLPDNPPDRPVSAELRHNLFLIVKEALNNTVRHARAGTARLKIAATDEALTLEIEDDGCGFEKAPDDALADGLRNMRQRAEEIGGRFQVESRPGKGTRVFVWYSWPRNG